MNRSTGKATDYDLIVLGAGAGGENVADSAIQGGSRRSDGGPVRWVDLAGIRQCRRVDFHAGAE